MARAARYRDGVLDGIGHAERRAQSGVLVIYCQQYFMGDMGCFCPRLCAGAAAILSCHHQYSRCHKKSEKPERTSEKKRISP